MNNGCNPHNSYTFVLIIRKKNWENYYQSISWIIGFLELLGFCCNGNLNSGDFFGDLDESVDDDETESVEENYKNKN